MAEPAEGRRERKKRALRQRIFDEAARLFLRQGFDATTVDEIAVAADVAQATFFNHYPSKDALLDEMTSEVLGVVRGLLEEQRKREASSAERIDALADRATQLIRSAPRLTRDVLRALMRRPEGAGELITAVRASVSELIRDGQAQGDVRRDRDASFLAEMLIGTFYGTITHWINEPDYPLAQRMRATAVFFEEAIAPVGEETRE